MITLILGLIVLTFLFGIAFRITGALLTASIWLFIKIPLACILFAVGIAFCCTLILIPLGVGCFKGATALIIPG